MIHAVDPDHFLLLALSEVHQPEDVVKVAVQFMQRQRSVFALFCADPSVESNRRIMSLLLTHRRHSGVLLFDPTPFLGAIQKLKKDSLSDRILRTLRKWFHRCATDLSIQIKFLGLERNAAKAAGN